MWYKNPMTNDEADKCLMNCIDPPALTELDLAIYLDGEADAAVIHHIAACPACRANATTLAAAQLTLFDQLYRSNCPTPEDLRDYQIGLLSRADRSNVALHLARCPHCTRELFLLTDFLNQSVPVASTPNLFDQIKFLVATLMSAPSSSAPALAGQRGDESGLLLYQADDIQIGVEVVTDPESGQQQLHGVVTSAALDDLLVHLWRNGVLIATAPVDPLLGDFHFTNLPTISATTPATTPATGDQQEAYELIISAQQVKLHVPRLPFGH